jgi:hypothetical protein
MIFIPRQRAKDQITYNSGRMAVLNAKPTMDKEPIALNHLLAVLPTSE